MAVEMTFEKCRLWQPALALDVSRAMPVGDDIDHSAAAYAVPTGVVQCVAVYCSVLQCVVVCCSSVLQCIAVEMKHRAHRARRAITIGRLRRVLQCVAVCCSVCCSV